MVQRRVGGAVWEGVLSWFTVQGSRFRAQEPNLDR
jgi:hypothetical protein